MPASPSTGTFAMMSSMQCCITVQSSRLNSPVDYIMGVKYLANWPDDIMERPFGGGEKCIYQQVIRPARADKAAALEIERRVWCEVFDPAV
jgi:hypothetical protein